MMLLEKECTLRKAQLPVVYKVVVRMFDGRRWSAIDHNCPVEYRYRQKSRSHSEPLFAFEEFGQAVRFRDDEDRNNWRKSGTLEIWRARAENPRRQYSVLLVPDPTLVIDFWRTGGGNAPDSFEVGDAPAGTVVCDSICLTSRVA
jgi:hypothetical protein